MLCAKAVVDLPASAFDPISGRHLRERFCTRPRSRVILKATRPSFHHGFGVQRMRVSRSNWFGSAVRGGSGRRFRVAAEARDGRWTRSSSRGVPSTAAAPGSSMIGKLRDEAW